MDSGNVPELAPEGPCGTMRTFGPKARNSVVRRRLASTCKLSRAEVTAAPAPRASSMTKSRPRFAPSKRGECARTYHDWRSVDQTWEHTEAKKKHGPKGPPLQRKC